jgi:hypothetical protein
MMGALIFTILTGVLMLFDFGGGWWRNDVTEGSFYISPLNSVWGLLIAIPLSGTMFYMAYWSSQAMRDPSIITVSKLFRFSIFSILIGVTMLILGIIFVSVMIADDYNDWWLDVGFYGGVIGGFLTAILFKMAASQAKALGYPDGDAKSPLPFDIPGVEAPFDQAPDTRQQGQPPSVSQPPDLQPPGQQPPFHQPPAQQPPVQQPPAQPPTGQQPPGQYPPGQRPPVP